MKQQTRWVCGACGRETLAWWDKSQEGVCPCGGVMGLVTYTPPFPGGDLYHTRSAAAPEPVHHMNTEMAVTKNQTLAMIAKAPELDLALLKEVAKVRGYRFEREGDTERMIRPDGTVAVTARFPPEVGAITIATTVEQDAVRQAEEKARAEWRNQTLAMSSPEFG